MKSPFSTASSLALAGLLSITSACAGSKSEPATGQAEGAATKVEPAAKTESKPEAQPAAKAEGEEKAKVETVAVKPDPTLDSYGKVHAHLVADKITDAIAEAKLLAASATEAAATAGESHKKALTDIQNAANALATADAAAADDVRKKFGEVSKAVIALLIADPSLAAGRQTFKCDMAKGFQKWVQSSGDLQNPYMGQRMPECGSKTELSL